MSKASILVSNFSLKGKLTEIHRQKDQIKFIKLTTDDGSYWIKITKKLKAKITDISCGSQLELKGKSKQKRNQNKVKYKAHIITFVSQNKVKNADLKLKTVTYLPIFDTQIKSKAKVLICQKSNCWKKGGREVYEALESVLKDRNLTKRIPLKKTGCLKKCKRAPNLVMLPDKAQYSKVKPKQIKSFVQKHLMTEA